MPAYEYMVGTSLLVDHVDLTFSSFTVAAQDTVKVLGTHSLKTAPVPSSLLRVTLQQILAQSGESSGKFLDFLTHYLTILMM